MDLRLVLHPDPAFLPKVVSILQLSQPVILPVFFLNLSDSWWALHCVNVRRALSFCSARNLPFCADPHLFITYEQHRWGRCISTQLVKWATSTIVLHYNLANQPIPTLVKAHSIWVVVNIYHIFARHSSWWHLYRSDTVTAIDFCFHYTLV